MSGEIRVLPSLEGKGFLKIVADGVPNDVIRAAQILKDFTVSFFLDNLQDVPREDGP